MASANCIARLIEAAGRNLTDKEVEGIFARIHKAALDIKAGRGENIRPTGLGQDADDIVSAAARRAGQPEFEERQAVDQRWPECRSVLVPRRQTPGLPIDA